MKRKRNDYLSSAKSTLRLRIMSSNLAASSHTTDEVVAHLRSHFREYSRLPKNVFTKNVERILTTLSQRRDEFEVTSSVKNSGATILSTSTTCSVDDNDAGFDSEIEPAFDLMKSALRDSYAEKNKSVRKPALEVETNIEIQTEGWDGRKLENEGISRNKEDAVAWPSFDDLGGVNGLLEVLEMKVVAPLVCQKLLKIPALQPMDGILLHGPPGCGKSMLARAIANEADVPFYEISAPDLVSGVSGDSEKKIRDLFKQAHMTAPSIIFIDEIDAIASKRENMHREMEKRIVAQLMTCMNAHHSSNNNEVDGESCNREHMPVLVIGATNRPDEIDRALRRPGRFGQEFALGVPDENARFEILSVFIKQCTIAGTVDLKKIARLTPGFVGVDLAALVKEANFLALNKILSRKKTELGVEKIHRWWRKPWLLEDALNSFCVSMSDFEDAIAVVQSSSKREGFSSIPSTKWDDIGGLESLRKEFEFNIVQHIKYPEDYKKHGMGKEDGFLLFGPPGCGKTLIAQAVANEAGANFIHVMGPELLNKYVGESERAIRTLFARARTCAPCILFFDEVDALTGREHDGGGALRGVASQLLIELQGGDNNQGVFVIGATNRPEEMDPAFLRPGRFGQIYYVGLPNADERSLILKALARDLPIAADVDLDAIARSDDCSYLSGADLFFWVMKQAVNAAVTESRNTGLPMVVKKSHFEAVPKPIVPSVKQEHRDHYERWRKIFQTRMI